jgi:hypothetical protein
MAAFWQGEGRQRVDTASSASQVGGLFFGQEWTSE